MTLTAYFIVFVDQEQQQSIKNEKKKFIHIFIIISLFIVII